MRKQLEVLKKMVTSVYEPSEITECIIDLMLDVDHYMRENIHLNNEVNRTKAELNKIRGYADFCDENARNRTKRRIVSLVKYLEGNR